jgi:hypothetical protein
MKRTILVAGLALAGLLGGPAHAQPVTPAKPVTLDPVVVPGSAASALQALSLSADDRAKIAASDEAHSRAYDARAAVMAYDKAHRPREFQIFGQITDRTSETSVLIYGKALPIGGKSSEFGTVVNDAAIFILGAELTNPVMFSGKACFIRREQDGATNSYGAKVPVWVFGPCTYKPDQRSRELEIKAQELEKIAKTKEAAAAPAQARLNAIKEREAAAEEAKAPAEAKAAAPAPEKPAAAVAASGKAVLVGFMSYQKQGRPTSVPVRWSRWFSSMELCFAAQSEEIQDAKNALAKAGIPLTITPDASSATAVSANWIDKSGIEIERRSECKAS